MDLGLKGKTALISGGSKGIGRAIGCDLAREGANVVLVARGAEALEEAKASMEALGGRVATAIGDMSRREDIARAASLTRDTFGGIDIAVSNTYPLHRYNFFEASEEDYLSAHSGMLLSVVELAREVLPDMKARGWGRLVNIGSFCMREPHRRPKLVLSNTYRLAVVGLNKSLADEFAPDGITVNSIATGYILTGRLNDRESKGSRVPMGRLGTPEEVAALCGFLCSERASYITGQLISVDGGLVAAY